MSKIIRKITIKEVVGSKVELLKIATDACPKAPDGEIAVSKGPAVKIMSILGHVSAVAAGQSDSGPFAKLKGEFEATNLIDGEVFHCATAILPNFASDPVMEALKAGAESVQFAIVFSVAYSETAATSYEFSAESLIPVKRASALEALTNQLKASGIALPAPAKAQQSLIAAGGEGEGEGEESDEPTPAATAQDPARTKTKRK